MKTFKVLCNGMIYTIEAKSPVEIPDYFYRNLGSQFVDYTILEVK